MIDRIKIENFKSLREINLKLGRMNLFIGTNASGKSNFFDALRLFQGIGNGFTFGEILDGKPRSATSVVWDGVRGGSAKACFEPAVSIGVSTNNEIRITVSGTGSRLGWWSYRVGFTPADGKLQLEALMPDVYSSADVTNPPGEPSFSVRYYRGKRGRQPHLRFERSRAVLGQFAQGGGQWTKADAQKAEMVATVFSNMQRLDPHPSVLRSYSQAQTVTRMGEHGENFAALVKAICSDAKQRGTYLEWLREMRPSEVDDIEVLRGALGEPLFALKEGGKIFPATVLSDGTLRFAAIAAGFFQPDMPGILTIEEIENGIHASRMRLMVELLRNQAEAGDTQIIATTHSPMVLAWLKPEEYQHVFFCKRNEETGESQIKPLSEIRQFNKAIEHQSIVDLVAEGWLEAAF